MPNQSVIIGGKEIPLVAPKSDLDLESRESGGKYHVPNKRQQYPFDLLGNDAFIPFRVSEGHALPTITGFGLRDGHKTVQVTFSNVAGIQSLCVQFAAKQRITQMVLKVNKTAYAEGYGIDSPQVLSLANANSLGANANVWRTANLAVINAKDFFGVGINSLIMGGDTFPVSMEFYLIDDLAPL